MPKKKKTEITIRSSAAEYLTYVASVGGEESSVEIRYEDEIQDSPLIQICYPPPIEAGVIPHPIYG